MEFVVFSVAFMLTTVWVRDIEGSINSTNITGPSPRIEATVVISTNVVNASCGKDCLPLSSFVNFNPSMSLPQSSSQLGIIGSKRSNSVMSNLELFATNINTDFQKELQTVSNANGYTINQFSDINNSRTGTLDSAGLTVSLNVTSVDSQSSTVIQPFSTQLNVAVSAATSGYSYMQNLSFMYISPSLSQNKITESTSIMPQLPHSLKMDNFNSTTSLHRSVTVSPPLLGSNMFVATSAIDKVGHSPLQISTSSVSLLFSGNQRTISIAMSKSVNILPQSSANSNGTVTNENKEDNEFNLIIIGVSAGAAALFVLVCILMLCLAAIRRRKRANHRSIPYHMNYSTPEKGQDELLGSRDSIEMYANLKYTFRDGFINKALDSEEGSLTTLPSSSKSSAPLARDTTFRTDETPNIIKSIDPHEANLRAPEVKHDVSVKLLEPWSEELSNRSSSEYIRLKRQVEDAMKSLFGDKDLKTVNVKGFRPGSVISDVCLVFHSSNDHTLAPLLEAVASGKLGELKVDSNYPLRAPDSIRSSSSTSPDVIPLSIDKPAYGNQYPLLMHGNDHAQDVSSLRASGNILERNPQASPFTVNQQSKKLQGKMPAYENFTPLKQMGNKQENSEVNIGYETDETNLSPNTAYRADSPENRDSGYIGSPTSCDVFFSNPAQVTQETGDVRGLSNKQKRRSSTNYYENAPVPVEPPKAPNGATMAPVEEIDSTAHVALFDFTPQDSRELALRQGELVKVLMKDNSKWVRVTNESNEQGWVPELYLISVSSSQIVTTKETVETLEYFDSVLDELDDTGGDYLQPVVPESGTVTEEDIYDDAVSPESSDDYLTPVDGHEDREQSHMLCISVFSFSGESPEELSFSEGEKVNVKRTTPTGWWKGSTSDGREGWFPSSYVKTVDKENDVNKEKTPPPTYENVPKSVPGNVPENVYQDVKGKESYQELQGHFQPPEKYTGLFVQILKRQSATDLNERFHMEDFIEGPSKPEREAPLPPPEVDKSSVGKENAKGSLQTSPKLSPKQNAKRAPRGLPPQRPVPPPPCIRSVAARGTTKVVKNETNLPEAAVNSAPSLSSEIPKDKHVSNKHHADSENVIQKQAPRTNQNVPTPAPRKNIGVSLSLASKLTSANEKESKAAVSKEHVKVENKHSAPTPKSASGVVATGNSKASAQEEAKTPPPKKPLPNLTITSGSDTSSMSKTTEKPRIYPRPKDEGVKKRDTKQPFEETVTSKREGMRNTRSSSIPYSVMQTRAKVERTWSCDVQVTSPSSPQTTAALSRTKPPIPLKRPPELTASSHGKDSPPISQSINSGQKPLIVPRKETLNEHHVNGLQSHKLRDINSEAVVRNETELSKPVRPPPPSFKSKLEAERLAAKTSKLKIQEDRSKIRTAIKPYSAMSEEELSFERGAILYEIEVFPNQGVCYGLLENGEQGYYPLSHVKVGSI